MTYKIIFSDTLEHHGVKGMKWGVRKSRDRRTVLKSMSEAGRARDTYLVYKQRQMLMKKKGKTDKNIDEFVKHQAKVSQKALNDSMKLINKMMKTYGKESINGRIAKNIMKSSTGEVYVNDPSKAIKSALLAATISGIEASITGFGYMSTGMTNPVIEESRAKADYKRYLKTR